jgi:predicted nucleic acid-binding protein
MSQDLTTSTIARQNVLNNPYALTQLETHLALGGLRHENKTIFTKAQVAEILDVDERTIDRYLKQFVDELKGNGYRILKGKALKDIKLAYVDDTNVVDIIDPKAPSLGVFDFRAILNIAMLVTESERAKAIRSRMLDIVLDVVAQKAGGHTKYINQRDADYLPAAYQEFSYRKAFTSALSQYLNMGNHKYGVYTNKIYQLIFKENAKEYKKILKLSESDKVRDTFYAEVLKAIASVENGLAEEMKQGFERLGRKLSPSELDEMIQGLENNPYLRPVIEDARTKMASRDLSFRDALHARLESYLQAVPESDFDRFLGETSKSLEEQLSDPEMLEVLKRLKDR